MKLSRLIISNILVFFIFFLTFFGYYAILIFIMGSGMGDTTRLVTLPVRILIIAMLISLTLINFNNIQIKNPILWFIPFSGLYIVRILIDYYWDKSYYLAFSEVLFYFFSFSIIPFLAISTYKLNEKFLYSIKNALLLSGFFFSFLTLYFYGKFIGQVSRLATRTAGEDVISPLALSYCSTLIIGVTVFYLLYNRTIKREKLIGIFLIGLATIPFFLGASRGSVIALFLPFILMLSVRLNLQNMIKVSLLFLVFVLGIVYLDQSFESGILNRFLGISEAIEEGSSSASRIEIWKASLTQFMENPFIGDSLKVHNFKGYPHNLFLEVLQTMGVVGFLPFSILIYSAFKNCILIFKQNPQYAWVAVIFLQAFVQIMFSGAIYTAAWFWTSMALVISSGYWLRRHYSVPVELV